MRRRTHDYERQMCGQIAVVLAVLAVMAICCALFWGLVGGLATALVVVQ